MSLFFLRSAVTRCQLGLLITSHLGQAVALLILGKCPREKISRPIPTLKKEKKKNHVSLSLNWPSQPELAFPRVPLLAPSRGLRIVATSRAVPWACFVAEARDGKMSRAGTSRAFLSLDLWSGLLQVFREQAIDGETLPLLTEEHLLNNMGLKLGPALKIRSQVGEAPV